MSKSVTNEAASRRTQRIRKVFVAGCLVCAIPLAIYVVTGAWVRSHAEITIRDSRRMYERRDFDGARAELEWLLWIEPEHPEALLLQGQTFLAEGRIDSALEALEAIEPSDGIARNAGRLISTALLHDGRLYDGELALVAHLERFPEDSAAAEELKWVYFNQLRVREVEGFLEARLRRKSGARQLLIDLLYTEFRRQVPRETVGVLEAADDRHPNQPSVMLALGRCYWKLGRIEEADVAFERAAELRPDHTDTQLTTAEFLLEQGRLDDAEELLDAVEIGADDMPLHDDRLWWLRSREAESRGAMNEALDSIRRGHVLRPNDLAYIHRLGMLLRRLNRPDESDALLERSHQLEDARQRLHLLVGAHELEQPTPALCRELAELCRLRGKELQARGWEEFAGELARRQADVWPGAGPLPESFVEAGR